jgi:hypothetical protein
MRADEQNLSFVFQFGFWKKAEQLEFYYPHFGNTCPLAVTLKTDTAKLN